MCQRIMEVWLRQGHGTEKPIEERQLERGDKMQTQTLETLETQKILQMKNNKTAKYHTDKTLAGF